MLFSGISTWIHAGTMPTRTCASVWVDQLSWRDAVSDPVLSSPQSKGGLVVAYHTAAWCGPCKAVWPHVVEMAAANPEVSFLKIDGLHPPTSVHPPWRQPRGKSYFNLPQMPPDSSGICVGVD